MEYGLVADLPLTVGSIDLRRRARQTSSGFERVTTTVRLRGEGELGRGEDVTYDTTDHERFATEAVQAADLEGAWRFDDFSTRLGTLDLFPAPPERDAARHYRRWAFESAALDLALRQADTHLGARLDRERDPVRFVASTRLGDPPTTDRLDELIARVPDVAFKLDPTDAWDDTLVAAIPADRVRILDLKGQYQGTDVDQQPNPELYRRVRDGFPDALLEDPALTDRTAPVFEGHEARIAWDLPITGVDSIENLPFAPDWLNIKPSRFGTIESLFGTLSYAAAEGISLYGGGQFELGVGRTHIQLLASLFYPDAPNDVAPSVYNEPDLPARLPGSPIAPRAAPRGLDF